MGSEEYSFVKMLIRTSASVFSKLSPSKPASRSSPSGGEEAEKEAGTVLPHSVHLEVLHVTAR